MTQCFRCHRILRNAAHVINGQPFGPTCARSVVAVPEIASDLLTYVDTEFPALMAMEIVRQSIDASAEREMAGWRAKWGAATP